MFSGCLVMAKSSCQLPQVNVPNVTQRLANDRMTLIMCIFVIFSQVSDRKLTRFPEPGGATAFNVAWSLESTLSAYLFKIGPPRSWRVGSAFVASALQNLMRRRKLCRLTNDLGRLASTWNSSKRLWNSIFYSFIIGAGQYLRIGCWCAHLELLWLVDACDEVGGPALGCWAWEVLGSGSDICMSCILVQLALTQVWLHGVLFPSHIDGLMSTRNTLFECVNVMDATNKMLCLVGHAINLDKMLTRIARLAFDSMLADVHTHQQMTQMSDVSFGATNHSAECNWHYRRALHRFFMCATTFGAMPTNRTL